MTFSTIQWRLLRTALVCGVLVVVSGFGLRSLLATSPAYPWTAAAVFAVMMALALAFIREHPFDRLGAANQVTLVRAMLIALVVAFIAEGPALPIAAAAVAGAAASAALDGLDGWLARRSRMASGFGARFDMETDALLILALSILVWQHGKAGPWIVAAGIMRYAFLAAGAMLPWMAGPLTPTIRGKAVAVSQVIGLSAALLTFQPPASVVIAGITLAALTWSFAIDVRRLWRQRIGGLDP